MIMNWDSSRDPRCSLLLTDPWYSVTIRVLVSVTGWRDSKHLWNSCFKRKDHLTDGICPVMMLVSSTQIFIPDLSSGASITSAIWASQTNSYPLQAGPGECATHSMRGRGPDGDTAPGDICPILLTSAHIGNLPTLEISISQWLIISQTQHCWHSLSVKRYLQLSF